MGWKSWLAALACTAFICCQERKGVYFKDVNSERFIGKASGSDELTVVEADNAIRFVLEDLENQAEKRLKTEDDKSAFSERGWWIFRKWYELNPKGEADRQGIRLVYSAPDVYILMRDDSCLSAESGIFRKEDCTNKAVNKFRMCATKKCNPTEDKLNRKLKFIQCALAHSMYQDLDRNSRASALPPLGQPVSAQRREQQHHKKKRRRQSSNESDMQCSDPCEPSETDVSDTLAGLTVLSRQLRGRKYRKRSSSDFADLSSFSDLDNSETNSALRDCLSNYNAKRGMKLRRGSKRRSYAC
ncbi:hypothetical protein PAPHI01_0958 [Pancytospora philotis]|nr:hypothetical protein PAPHI01_0958 [Pancytospora philotis]